MKDKHGNELPEPFYETRLDKPYEGESAKCHNCKSPLKGTQFTYRYYGDSGAFNHAVQGPLCPNCSELPPEYLPSRKVGERWW